MGAGNVLNDMIHSKIVPCFRLSKVFRQAEASSIIQYAHQINTGLIPAIPSPFKTPEIWQDGSDRLFLDSEEATKEQSHFISRVKKFFDWKTSEREEIASDHESPFVFRSAEPITSAYEQDFVIPKKYEHVDLEKLSKTDNGVDALKTLMKKIHPWSSLHYGLSAVDIMAQLYLEWVPKYRGKEIEIQILSPMTRGTLGTVNLNKIIQEQSNPAGEGKHQLRMDEKIFREGERVIHRRNNYDLNVFNGDIGKITQIDNENLSCLVCFYPDAREVQYKKENLMELDLAYAITIHKSQGSEFQAVIIPIFTQHYKMLYRKLIYTGVTRARKLAVIVGTRRAFSMAIGQQDAEMRQADLEALLQI